jgi:Holliday junction DNA helicase RuvA
MLELKKILLAEDNPKDVELTIEALSDSAGRELPEEAVLDDVLSALVNLGYKDVQVRKVLADLDTQADASVEQVLKQALKILMR